MALARFTAALVALLFATSAHAQDPDPHDYARDSFYAALGWAYALEDFDDTGGLSIDDANGVSARLGYRFHPNFAAELQGDWYEDFDVDGTVPVLGIPIPVKGEAELWTLLVNGKGYLLTGQFQPYGLLGAGILSADLTLEDDIGLGVKVTEDDTSFVWQVGAGVDYYLFESDLALTAEGAYHIPTGSLDDVKYWTVTVGLLYRF